MTTTQEFIGSLQALSFSDTFNPYVHRCPVYDIADAPQRRSLALLNMLEAAASCEIDAVWIGRDLGYRGGRRTGLALTDDIHINRHACRWGVAVDRPTKGQPMAERTAAVIWNVLDEISVPIFLWNVFPLHPHDPDEPFSNRAHNTKERQAGEELMADLLSLLSPRRIIAIGNDAARSASRIARSEVFQVRHPSYGGQTEFLKQIKELFACRKQALL